MSISKHTHRETKNARSLARRAGKRRSARILVVCEGEKTEPNYFNGLKDELKLRGANVEITGDSGSSPKSVVAHAKKLHRQAEKIDNPFTDVFCVIDRDEHTDYDDAMQQIRDMNKSPKPRCVFHAIPSIPCFEYFLLLHFTYTTKSLDKCRQAESELKKHLPAYKKGDKNIFPAVCAHLETAKTNAAKSLAAAARDKTKNPTTKAHELVEFMQNIKRTPRP